MDLHVLYSGGLIYTRDGEAPFSTSLLLEGGGRRILIDPGWLFTMKALERKLHERNLSSRDITDIVLTHFHLDHMLNSMFFPNAVVHIHELWKGKDYRKFGDMQGQLYAKVVESWKEVKEFGDREELFGCMKVFHTPYHSREHVSLVVESDNLGRVFIPGDICPTRFDYYDVIKGYRKDDVAWFILENSSNCDLIVFSHDEPLEPSEGRRK